MNKLRISLIQSPIFWEDIDSNIKLFESKILNSEKSDIFVLPEMFTSGFTNNVINNYETENGKTINWMKEISKNTDAAICGSMIFYESEKFYNRFVFIEPDGKVNFYNKRHLFGIGGETDIFSRGTNNTIVNFRSFKIQLLVCYDLRFPVWSRNTENYDLIIYTANWPSTRRYAWDVLLKARAIENQSYVAGINRVGTDENNLLYNGGSCIIDPKGEIIVDANDNEEKTISAIICKDKLYEFREKFPFLKDMDSFKII